MAIHESQSRLWENHVGRSSAFWEHWFPQLATIFPEAMTGLDPESLVRTVNIVCPGTNRVAADEVSYHLHILLRYELELALISGDLAVADLPDLWNQRCEELLGVAPASDLEGVLQDVHWSLGMFGYFPTYTLGTLYAAQLAETYGQQNSLEAEIRQGRHQGLLKWLKTNIHSVGYRENAEEIITSVTGRGLDTSALIRHLERRYS
jgi:carboxypeptidase Taq